MRRLLNGLIGISSGILIGGVIALVSAPPRGVPVTLRPAPTPAPLVVHVSGAVAQPGVYELPRGARVRDAVAAAGGALPEADLTGLNLAAQIRDGSQITIAAQSPEPQAPAAPGLSTATPAAARININTAGIVGLDGLPGIGPSIAQRIIDYREQNGDFEKIADIVEVSGIGPSTFEKIKDLITTGP